MNHGTGNYRLSGLDCLLAGRWYYFCFLLLALSGKVNAASSVSFSGTAGTLTWSCGPGEEVYFKERDTQGTDYWVGTVLKHCASNTSGTFTFTGNPAKWYMTEYSLNNGSRVLAWYQPVSTTEKKSLPWSITNNKDYAITYVIKDKDGNFLVEQVVQPGETKTGVLSYNADLGPITHDAFVPADFTDGAWITAPGNPVTNGTAVPIPNPPQGTPYTAPTQPQPTSPVVPIPLPSNIPNSGVIQPGSQTVWVNGGSATEDAERLDKATFKEGTDKVVDAIERFRQQEKDARTNQSEDENMILTNLAQGNQGFSQLTMEGAIQEAENRQISIAQDITNATDAVNSAPITGGPGENANGGTVTMNMAKVGSKNFINFPSSININPVTTSYVPDWLKSVFALVKALIGYGIIGWLWIVTHRDVRRDVLGVLSVNREGDSTLERMALNVPIKGMAVAMGFRIALMVWITATVVALVPFAVSLYENEVFGNFNAFRSEVNSLLATGGDFGKLLGMAIGIVPFYTFLTCYAFRIFSSSAISYTVIPLALTLRTFKV